MASLYLEQISLMIITRSWRSSRFSSRRAVSSAFRMFLIFLFPIHTLSFRFGRVFVKNDLGVDVTRSNLWSWLTQLLSDSSTGFSPVLHLYYLVQFVLELWGVLFMQNTKQETVNTQLQVREQTQTILCFGWRIFADDAAHCADWCTLILFIKQMLPLVVWRLILTWTCVIIVFSLVYKNRQCLALKQSYTKICNTVLLCLNNDPNTNCCTKLN